MSRIGRGKSAWLTWLMDGGTGTYLFEKELRV